MGKEQGSNTLPAEKAHTYLPNRAAGGDIKSVVRTNPLSLADGGLSIISRGTLGEKARVAELKEDKAPNRQLIDPSLGPTRN